MTYPDYGKGRTHIVKGRGDGLTQGSAFEQSVLHAGGIFTPHGTPPSLPGGYDVRGSLPVNPDRRWFSAQCQSGSDLWLKFHDGTGADATWRIIGSGGSDG